jgi:sortase A
MSGPGLFRYRVPTGAAVVVWVSLSCALLCVWIVGYALGVSGLSQARSQEELYGQFREQLALATAPIGGEIPRGDPVALLEAPSIHLRQVVVEGTTSGELRSGPGHRRNTPLPGQPGTSVVYGHAAIFGGPFRSITQLKSDDVITATTGQGRFEYRVNGVRRAKDPLPVPLQQGGGRLTLVTAEGHGWRTGWAPDQVVYVDATLVGNTQLGTPGRPRSVTTSEFAMQADPEAFIPLVLWLQVLALAATAAVVTRWRWGGVQTWFVGVPVLLAGLWGMAEAMTQLLPNLS